LIVLKMDSLLARLERAGQSHLLRFFDELDESGKKALLAQIEAIDFDLLPELIERHVRSNAQATVPDDLEPAPYYARDGQGARPWDVRKYRSIGVDLLEQGRVACFTVAGGQGSRLGYDGPKGCFPTGCVTGKSLFQIFAEKIRGAERTFGADVPWYIMTSPLNHDETRRFFARWDYFGLDPANVMFFMQGTMPSLDKNTGQILLADKGTIATNPDGHGGSLKALHVSGALEDMKQRGVDTISYFQVDNPNVNITDPVFIGLHAAAPDSSAEMSSKMVPKTGPEEKVGVFCRSGGKLRVIEYSDLPCELASARNEDGSLRFLAGSIAIHLISVAFVEKINSDAACALPYHRAIKKVPCIDLETGRRVEPTEPNAIKLERFVFDAIPFAEQSIVLETDRIEEFAPVKNATGVDSIETSHRLQTEKAARWLESVGVKVPRRDDGTPDCVLELSGITAIEPAGLDRASLPDKIEPGAVVAI